MDILINRGASIELFFSDLRGFDGAKLATGAGLTGVFATTIGGVPVENALNLAAYTEADGLQLNGLTPAQSLSMVEGNRPYVLRLFLSGTSTDFIQGDLKVSTAVTLLTA